MAILKKQLASIDAVLKNLIEQNKITSKKLMYSVVKNLKAIEPELDALKKAFETDSKEYVEYVEAVREVYRTYGQVNESGDSLIPANNKLGWTIKADSSKTEDEIITILENLQAKYIDAISIRDTEIAEYNTLLEQPAGINLLAIKFEDLPDDIDAQSLFILDELISEPAN